MLVYLSIMCVIHVCESKIQCYDARLLCENKLIIQVVANIFS